MSNSTKVELSLTRVGGVENRDIASESIPIESNNDLNPNRVVQFFSP